MGESSLRNHVSVCGVKYLVLDWLQVENLALTMDDVLERVVLERTGRTLEDIRREVLIIGIKRWGDNVMNHLSDAFGIEEVRSLGIRSYDKDFKRGPLEVYQPLNLEEDLARFELVILVDGVIDSGHTLMLALKLLEKYRPRSVISSSLLVKSNAIVFPDVYGDVVGGDYWIAFPWEKFEIARKVAQDMRDSEYKDEECFRVLCEEFRYDRRIIAKCLV
jgi:hypoxanthine phosphoribosyltransferase